MYDMVSATWHDGSKRKHRHQKQAPVSNAKLPYISPLQNMTMNHQKGNSSESRGTPVIACTGGGRDAGVVLVLAAEAVCAGVPCCSCGSAKPGMGELSCRGESPACTLPS